MKCFRFSRLGRSLLILLLQGSALATAIEVPPGPGAPSLVFTAQAVQAQGMTPGGAVVWFGVGREVVEYSAVQSLRQVTAVADAQGRAALSVAAGVPRQSVWLALDLKTGAYAEASPAGFSPGRLELPGGLLSQGGGSAADQFLDPADFVHLLLVRPGQGAWGLTVGRGGPKDEASLSESGLRVSFGNFEALVPGVPAPVKLNPKDLLLVVHPRTMEIGILPIG